MYDQFRASTNAQEREELCQKMLEIHKENVWEIGYTSPVSTLYAINAKLPETTGELVVDLADVPYIDSTGIGVLVGAAHRAQEQGATLVVAHPQRNVARVLGMLGVEKDLNIREA